MKRKEEWNTLQNDEKNTGVIILRNFFCNPFKIFKTSDELFRIMKLAITLVCELEFKVDDSSFYTYIGGDKKSCTPTPWEGAEY